MPDRVCLDASLALMWLIAEPFTDSALALRLAWANDSVELIAPPIFRPEVTSAIRLRVYRGDLSPEDGGRALGRALSWPLVLLPDSDSLQRDAYQIATTYGRPRAYDAQYLALAQSEGCDFWTGDERLINALQGRMPWAHWIGEYQPA